METVTLKTIYRELADIKGELKFLKHIIQEEHELSDWAKGELKEARKTPNSKLVNHEDVKKRILGK